MINPTAPIAGEKNSDIERYRRELLRLYKNSGYAAASGTETNAPTSLPDEVEKDFPVELFESGTIPLPNPGIIESGNERKAESTNIPDETPLIAAEPMKKNEQCPSEQSCGYLRVVVTAGDTEVPIENAHIAVYIPKSDGERELYRLSLTDESGRTPSFPLPAPPAEQSLTPQPRNVKPFAEYTVRVTADGFYPLEDVNVPVFAGIVSVQKAPLTPFVQYEQEPDITMRTVIESEPDL